MKTDIMKKTEETWKEWQMICEINLEGRCWRRYYGGILKICGVEGRDEVNEEIYENETDMTEIDEEISQWARNTL